ncbi:hypothetical protein Harman_17020 [Haloarcula mannanilytica]|uniref:Uncharacterized protein n=1 Tax=Haloarcula mannanilytica TaxID=2509225 RepID=A0A4C2EJB1_9EURY|nr:hypothetical protein Harman_17020 [Haloarcula mannanilytica]
MLSYTDWLSSGTTTVLSQLSHTERGWSNVRSQNGQTNRVESGVSDRDMAVQGAPYVSSQPLGICDTRDSVAICIAVRSLWCSVIERKPEAGRPHTVAHDDVSARHQFRPRHRGRR